MQILSADVFQDEPGRAHEQCFGERVVVVVGGEREHRRRVGVRAHSADRLRAADSLHTHVHEDDIRFEVVDHPHDVFAIGTFSDDVESVRGTEQQAESLAHEALIVDENDRDELGFGVADLGRHQSLNSRPVRCRKTCSRFGSMTSMEVICT